MRASCLHAPAPSQVLRPRSELRPPRRRVHAKAHRTCMGDDDDHATPATRSGTLLLKRSSDRTDQAEVVAGGRRVRRPVQERLVEWDLEYDHLFLKSNCLEVLGLLQLDASERRPRLAIGVTVTVALSVPVPVLVLLLHLMDAAEEVRQLMRDQE